MDKIEREKLKRKLERREILLDRALLYFPFFGAMLIFLWTHMSYALAFYSQTGYHVYPRSRSDPARILLTLREIFFFLPLAFSLGLYNSKGEDEYGCRLVAFDEKKTLWIKLPLLLASIGAAIWIWRSDIAGLEEAKAELFYKTAYIFGSYLIAAVVYLGTYLLFRAKNSEVQRISLQVMKNDTVVLDIIFIGIFLLTAILLIWVARGTIRLSL